MPIGQNKLKSSEGSYMTLAIMQPYFFPYIGYWQLMHAVDTFVLFDNIQFSKSGWFHRNNILLNGKKTLFTIPLKKDSDLLNVVERYLADDSERQLKKILAQITNSYRKAPYFSMCFPIIKDIFLNKDKNLFDYIYYSIINICQYLEIETNIIISSSINIDHNLKSKDKVIAINKELNSNKYINPIGGKELYSQDDFERENIELMFLSSGVPKYKQFDNDYIAYLSIIDIMMFCSIDEIKTMLDKFELIKN